MTISILRQFRAGEPDLGVSQLARRLDLDKATVHRALRTLAEERFVEQDPVTKRYRLGMGVLDLAMVHLASFEFIAVSSEEIRKLSMQIGETVTVHALEGHEMVCLNYVDAAHPVRVKFFVGERSPLQETASGRAMLSAMPKEQWLPLVRQTREGHGPAGADDADLHEILQTARRKGYAVVDETYETGVRAIGAVVRDAAGSVVCAISIAAPAQRRSVAELEEFAPLLLDTCNSVGQKLRGQNPSANVDGRLRLC